MAYQLVDNSYGQFAVDWTVVDHLIEVYWKATMRDAYSRVTTTSDSKWYNPFSWSLPDIAQVDVDWDLVSSKARIGAEQERAEMRRLAQYDCGSMAVHLETLVAQTGRLTKSFLDQMASVQSENAARIGNAVSSYDSQIAAAKFLRDTSADGLMVGATILSGGAAAGVLAGGSALKGWAKYQDTDNVGAAVMTGVGNLVFGIIPMGGPMTAGEQWALAIIQGVWESSTALVEGKSVSEAIPIGALKLAGPLATKVFGSAPVRRMLARAALPMKVTVITETEVNIPGQYSLKRVEDNIADQYLGRLGPKVVQKQIVEGYGKPFIHDSLYGSPPSTATTDVSTPPPRGPRVVRNATFENDALLKLAIVNMSKGIGRGW